MHDLQALQHCEMEMLKEFVGVCNKLGLKYYLLGGTLLGAVRHQGFIPWDDDIDVGMFREDYEKFLDYGQTHLPEHYFIQTHHTDPQWPANFAKIRDGRTTFIETSVKNQRINHGVYIDIFPLDHYVSNKAKQRLFTIQNTLMKLRISKVFTVKDCVVNVPIWKRCAKRLLVMLSDLLYPSLKDALNAREELFRSMPTGRLRANHCGAWGKKEIVPEEWYGEGTMLSFCGLSVRAPKHYDKWLTQVYGDYMKLPPVEKRVAHHYNEVIDLQRPYTEYVSEEGNE